MGPLGGTNAAATQNQCAFVEITKTEKQKASDIKNLNCSIEHYL